MIGDIPLADAIDGVPAHRLDRRVELDGRDHDARGNVAGEIDAAWACAPARCARRTLRRLNYPASSTGSGVIWLANGGGVTVGRSGSVSSPKSVGVPSSATSLAALIEGSKRHAAGQQQNHTGHDEEQCDEIISG